MSDSMLNNQINQPIPDWKLKFFYFYAGHKSAIKKGFIFSIFFVDLIIVFLLGSILINYQTGLIADESYLRLLPVNFINYNQYKQAHQPEDLKISKTDIIYSGNNSYDLVVAISNDNKDWAIIELVYSFIVDGVELEPETTFLLPADKKYLFKFNQASVNQADLKIIKTRWKRIEDFSLLSYQNSIEINRSLFEYSPSAQLNGQVKATIFNDSPYNFWEVGLFVVLRDRNSSPIGIEYISINKLLSKEERELEIGWPYEIRGRVSTVDIVPEINLLDNQAIMEIEAPPGSPPGLE